VNYIASIAKLDLLSQDVNVRRLSKLICEIYKYTEFDGIPAIRMLWFMENVDYYKGFKRLIEDHENVGGLGLIPPTPQNKRCLIRCIEEDLRGNLDQLYMARGRIRGYSCAWGIECLISTWTIAMREGKVDVAKVLHDYTMNRCMPALIDRS
jgi:hypothetical protein